METETLQHPSVKDDCTAACDNLLRVIRQHAAGCAHYVNPHGKAWCRDCRRHVPVEDVTTEGHMERQGEVAYRVEHMECGHANSGPARVVAAAPGAPEPMPRSYVLGQQLADADPWMVSA